MKKKENNPLTWDEILQFLGKQIWDNEAKNGEYYTVIVLVLRMKNLLVLQMVLRQSLKMEYII